MFEQGDGCEGYPLKFCGLASRGRLSGKTYPVPDSDSPRPTKIRRLRSGGQTTGDLSPPDLLESIDHVPPINQSDSDHDSTIPEDGISFHSFSPNVPLKEKDSEYDRIFPENDSHGTLQVDDASPESMLSRDDVLLRPLDAISGANIAAGQRILMGLNTFSSSEPAILTPEYSTTSVTPARRIPWKSRVAAVRLDALPSLVSDQGELPNLDQERVQFLLEYCKN